MLIVTVGKQRTAEKNQDSKEEIVQENDYEPLRETQIQEEKFQKNMRNQDWKMEAL